MKNINNANADEILSLAKPLIDYMRENHHPHCSVLITSERVSIQEDLISIPHLTKPENDADFGCSKLEDRGMDGLDGYPRDINKIQGIRGIY